MIEAQATVTSVEANVFKHDVSVSANTQFLVLYNYVVCRCVCLDDRGVVCVVATCLLDCFNNFHCSSCWNKRVLFYYSSFVVWFLSNVNDSCVILCGVILMSCLLPNYYVAEVLRMFDCSWSLHFMTIAKFSGFFSSNGAAICCTASDRSYLCALHSCLQLNKRMISECSGREVIARTYKMKIKVSTLLILTK